MARRVSQREHVEYAERLKDAQEDFEAESLALIASGDRETLVRRSREHGEWVRAYRLDGVARGVEYGGGVGMSTNMWAHWGYIAIDAEERAVKALQREDDDWLTDSFRSSLTAIVAAAFTIEGLNGAVCYFIPELEARQRWTKIMRTLQVQFDLSRINRLSQKMELLFELRDNATPAGAGQRVHTASIQTDQHFCRSGNLRSRRGDEKRRFRVRAS